MPDETLDELRLLRSTARDFLAARAPVERIRRGYEADAPVDRELWREMGSLGWLAMLADGDEQGVQMLAAVAEELGRVVFDQPVLAANLVARALARCGSPEQRGRYLEPLECGDLVAAVDPDAWGPRPGGVALTATPTAPGFRLDGIVALVERGDEADLLLVAATLPGGSVGHFLVPGRTPGVRATRLHSLDLGRRYASAAFDAVQLGADAVLEVEPADADTQRRLAAVLACAESVGAAARAFEITFSYVRTRVTFGRILGSYQVVKHRLSDLSLWLETARAVTDAAVDALARGGPDAEELASVAKAYLDEKAPLVGRECLQLHGGVGFTWEHDIHLYLRRIEANALVHGDPDDHLFRIADVLMGSESPAVLQALAS